MGTWLWIVFGGGAMGMLLGALGAGGSVLTLPMFVFLFRQPLPVATASSLVVVALVSATSVVGHARQGNIHFRSAVSLGAMAIVGSTLGAFAVRAVAREAFLVGFAGLLVAGSVALWRVPNQASEAVPESVLALTWQGVGRLLGLGSVIGFLTGFFGVGGGFLIVPVLVVGLGFPMQKAVGTSLWVVMVAALSGLGTHLGASLPWAQVLPFAFFGAVGSVLGQRGARRLDTRRLRQAFSLALLALAVFILFQNLF
jgi:hypothetical protein